MWAPDSKHILFDSGGQLFLYSLDNGTAIDIASTGAESGDDPKFSPNGQFVSYVRDHNLYVHRFKDQASEIQLTTTHEDTMLNGEVDWVYLEELNVRSNYFWSPDSARIAFLQMNEANVPEYPITDWIPLHATVDKQRYPQPGDPNPGGACGRDQGAGQQDRLDQAYRSPMATTIFRAFGWIDPETLWIETLARDHKHRSIYFADAQHGDAKLAYTESDDKFFDDKYDVQFVSGEFYLTSWRDGHTHIYRYGFDQNHPMGGEGTSPVAHLLNQVTSGDYEVEASSRFSMLHIRSITSPMRATLFKSRFGRLRPTAAASKNSPRHRAFMRRNFAPLSPTFVDIASDQATPPQYSVCHSAECKAFYTSKPLDAGELTPAESLQLTAADGKTVLYGDLLLPPGPDGGGERAADCESLWRPGCADGPGCLGRNAKSAMGRIASAAWLRGVACRQSRDGGTRA